MNQPLCLYGHEFSSHLLLGTAAYPSLDVLQQAVAAAQPAMITVSLLRIVAVDSGLGLCVLEMFDVLCLRFMSYSV